MTVNDDDLPDWTPATCTLPKAEQPLRVAEFDELFRDCVTAVDRADATSVWLTLDGGHQIAARVLELTARGKPGAARFSPSSWYRLQTASVCWSRSRLRRSRSWMRSRRGLNGLRHDRERAP